MPVGERGELMFRGPLVMLGYHGNEQATAAAIERDGWLHTGDIATMEVTREELISYCREHLAAYKVPRALQFTTDVPTTSSGKIMRRLLSDIDDGAR